MKRFTWISGFVISGQEKKVCKLVKSIYSLKQAQKQCYENFGIVILSNDFVINNDDKHVYIKLLKNACVILCLYADDIFIFGTNLNVINDTSCYSKILRRRILALLMLF